MQHTNTKRITDTISFQHHITLPAISTTDCLITAIKQLQDAITKHVVPAVTTEEKAIDTLRELLTAPTQPKFPAKATLVPETTHPHTNIAILNTTNLSPQGIPKQPNLYQPHIIIQDDNEWDEHLPQNINTTCGPEPTSLLTALCHPLYQTCIST